MGCLGMIVSDTSSCSISERMVWNRSWRHVVFVSMLCSWFFNWCFERQTLNAMLPMEKKLWCQSECFLLERFVLESWLTDRYEAFQRHHQKASFCRIQKSMHVGKVKYGRTVDVSRFQVSAVLTWELFQCQCQSALHHVHSIRCILAFKAIFLVTCFVSGSVLQKFSINHIRIFTFSSRSLHQEALVLLQHCEGNLGSVDVVSWIKLDVKITWLNVFQNGSFGSRVGWELGFPMMKPDMAWKMWFCRINRIRGGGIPQVISSLQAENQLPQPTHVSCIHDGHWAWYHQALWTCFFSGSFTCHDSLSKILRLVTVAVSVLVRKAHSGRWPWDFWSRSKGDLSHRKFKDGERKQNQSPSKLLNLGERYQNERWCLLLLRFLNLC